MKTYSRKKSDDTGDVIINLNELCRLCLSKSDELVPIFNDEESIPLPLRIMACVALEVVEDDGLPNMICSACKYQLEKSYVFRKKCESSDLKLRRHLRLISDSNKLLEDEDEIDNPDESKSTIELTPAKSDKILSEKSLQVKKLISEILEDETNDDNAIEILEQAATGSELLGATITYIPQPDNEICDNPENITLPLEMEEANKDACTLKTELKNEIIDMEQAEEELDISQVYYVDVNPSPENTDSQSSQNYEAIAELVKSTLSNQPGFSGELHVKLQPTRETTQVQVTTDDGSVMVMELMTEEEAQPQVIQQDEEGELKIWQCPNCPKAFSRRIQLNRHSSVHMQQRGFTCNICEKWFPTRSALVRHERIHTGEKPFECGICKRCFAQKEVLFRHLMTHSGEKPYQCSHCDKGFTQREALRSHMRQHIKPNPADIQLHRCSLCPKVFCHASGLSRHLLTHTGKTFKCRDCDKSFSDKSSLRRHHRLMFHQA